MKNWYRIYIPVLFFLSVLFPGWQQAIGQELPVPDYSKKKYVRRKDVFDVVSSFLNQKIAIDTLDTEGDRVKDFNKSTVFTVLPNINYSLVTRWAFGGMFSSYYYLDKKQETNMSSSDLLAIYTTQQQLIFKIKSNIWSSGNRMNIITDWRYMKFPSYSFGLGPSTLDEDKFLLDYRYLRAYQNIFVDLFGAFYIGFGYMVDYHFDIKDFSTIKVSDYQLYNSENKSSSLSAGPTFNVLYDSRENRLNPIGGRSYGYAGYRKNLSFPGGGSEWQSLTLDGRKYIKLPRRSTNVLALWSYNWFTFGGKVPYLDLPSTAWDAGDVQGRGYIQGRFRGNNLMSLETEYRFSITKNKVLGGVVFTNVQSVSVNKTFDLDDLHPAAGLGIRLKLNKQTNTNLSIDFAVGKNGSQSIFFNIGEVF